MLYSFVDEDNNKFNGATTLIINGAEVLAINSPKVSITMKLFIIL